MQKSRPAAFWESALQETDQATGNICLFFGRCI
jgi:hypothetical protein